MAAYLASHALTLAAVIAWLVMLTRISGSQRTPQSTLAWLLAFALVPVIAIPLYMALGSRKFPKRAKSRELKLSPVRSGNSFELITTGEAAYERLIGLLRDAKRTVDVTVFILGDDATGRAVVDALVECAKRGVTVRVIVDAVGSMRIRKHAAKELAAVGAKLLVFMPLRHSPVRGRTNLRSHRKVMIVDEEIIFAGGMNYALEYMGLPKTDGKPRWRDVVAVVRGPAAADATALFESDWAFCGGARRAEHTTPADAGDTQLRFVPSGPDMTTDTMYDILLEAIYAARERVAIVTPYYVPDEALQHALVLAARRGVTTELLVPAKSNHALADVARRAMVRELAANGVIVHYYTPCMVHAKAMLVDDAFAYVGSPNFDMRSLFLNYEDALCVYSPEAIAQIRGFIDELIHTCGAPPPKESTHRIVEQLAELLAPEL